MWIPIRRDGIAQEHLQALVSENSHESGQDRLGSLCICRADILHRRADRAVPECLLHESQVDVARDEMRSERVLQSVRMSLFGWQASGLRDGLEDPKELRAVQSATFLRREQEV